MVTLKAKIAYGALVVGPFFFGLFIVNIPFLRENLSLKGDYSFLSGLSLASWAGVVILFYSWLKSRKSNKIISIKYLPFSIAILLFFSIALYPPIMLVFGYWNSPLLTYTGVALGYALLTAFASLQVFLLGLNSSYSGNYPERDEIIKFLLTSITLVSLTSVALAFVLSSSGYNVAMSPTYQRAVVTVAYCLVPIATYCLGYLAKMLRLAVAEGVGLALSLILSFIIGASVLSVMLWNSFIFSAIIPLFLVVGLSLAIYEKRKALSNPSK